MNFEEYDNHISQKLKLAVAVALIRSVPDNLSTHEYINQLKSNILHETDPELECSVCSDDFNHSDHNLTLNNNTSDIDNKLNSTNPSLINNCNKKEILKIDDVNISHSNNNCYDNPINSSKNDYNNTDLTINCVINNDIDNTALSKESQAVNVTINEEYDTNLNINERTSHNVGVEENDNNILYINDGISLMDTDYEDLIDEVLQLHESPTILNDFCVNDFGNTDKVANVNNNKDAKIVYRQEMLSQRVFNTIPTVDVTQNLECNDDDTYYDSNKDTRTETNANIYEKLLNCNKKAKDNDRSFKLVDTYTKDSNLKHDLNIDHECSPKRRKNTHTDLKLPLDNPISDPYSRIKTNISKYLENNNNVANKPKISENVHVKETDGSKTVNKKPDTFNTECTQYGESQPPLVIDQKYIYEKSKSTSRIGIDQNISTEVTKKGMNISTNATKDTNINNNNNDIHHDMTYINPNTSNTVQEIPNYRTNTTKIIENDTAFDFEREIFHISEEICKARTDDAKVRIDYTNTKMNPTLIIGNNPNNRSKEILETTYVLETFSRDIPINNINTMQYPTDSFSQQNNNNRNINDNYNKTTTQLIDLTENNLPIENSIANDMNTMQYPADSFSQQNNNNRNINDNYNKTTTQLINLTENNFPIENSIANDINTMQYPADSFSQQNNKNRNINNNYNKTTTQTVDLTESEEEEISNQNSKSDSNLTDSDEDRTEEAIPFKVIEELNKIKVYLNRIDRFCESSSDTGYKSDSVSRHSLQTSQSNTWLNQSARSLFLYITSCQLISTTKEITREISVVLSELIQKLHDDDTYMSFMEDVLETTDSLLHSVLDAHFDEHQMTIQDGTTQRILLLNKCIHIQKYTIQKITHILETIHTNLYGTETYEAVDIQKIENLCHIFHILQIILQRYYKNQEYLKKKQKNSQKSQLDSQKSQYFSQKNQFDGQYNLFSSQNTQLDSQKSQFNSQNNQKSQHSSQKSQFSSQKSQISSQNSQLSSQNSQVVLRKTDISDIWRKKWNPNFREDKNNENLATKCALTDCSDILNKLIVSCMDGYELIAYSALKCFNLMQPN